MSADGAPPPPPPSALTAPPITLTDLLRGGASGGVVVRALTILRSTFTPTFFSNTRVCASPSDYTYDVNVSDGSIKVRLCLPAGGCHLLGVRLTHSRRRPPSRPPPSSATATGDRHASP